ncbi:phosphorylase family protein [Streptomyces sp. NBC_01803]|uniref:phosphorylase family protein n=1 Tax=Streptomyces sp. NBC_01803 TaxID=2975946 RepID=UPI002DD9D115|nr:hypothetical protein [Streptomyces sp. NBC_01803]WSA46852.1 hypothetical protein OIE51_23305 [Streptomyces sp. NBC_01803]
MAGNMNRRNVLTGIVGAGALAGVATTGGSGVAAASEAGAQATTASGALPSGIDIAVVGGTFVGDELLNSEFVEDEYFTVDTEYGESGQIRRGETGGTPFYYVHDHGGGRYPSTWLALRELGVRAVIGGGTAGWLNRRMEVCDFIIPDDFIDFNVDRPRGLPHTGLARYSPTATTQWTDAIVIAEAERRLRQDGSLRDITLHEGGVVAQAAGWRFETKAEIRMMKMVGCDMVTLSVGTEMSYARMLGIDYSCIMVISNPAEGLGDWEDSGERDVYATVHPVSRDIVISCIPRFAEQLA